MSSGKIFKQNSQEQFVIQIRRPGCGGEEKDVLYKHYCHNFSELILFTIEDRWIERLGLTLFVTETVTDPFSSPQLGL